MSLKFRNLDVTPNDPAELWGFEGLLAAVDRGELGEWQRIVAVVRAHPWSPVAKELEEALEAAEDTGVANALLVCLADARGDAERTERAEVASQVRTLIDRSGLSRKDFAARIGTSTSRLSTYATGRVVPSAALLVRMGRVAEGA